MFCSLGWHVLVSKATTNAHIFEITTGQGEKNDTDVDVDEYDDKKGRKYTSKTNNNKKKQIIFANTRCKKSKEEKKKKFYIMRRTLT